MLYFSHLLPDEEMRELLSETGMGIESIEFSISENLDHLDRTLAEYQRRLSAIGGKELLLHGPFLDLNPAAYDRLVRQATRTRFEQAYTAAKRLGAKKIIFHAGYIPKVYFLEGWAPRVAGFFREFLSDKDDSIQILMENVLDPSPWPLREAAEQIDHPAFGLCLDLGHAHCYSSLPLADWQNCLLPHLLHIHLHDNDGARDAHSAPGKGTAPLVPILCAAYRQNPALTCTIECNTKSDVRAAYSWWMETAAGLASHPPKPLHEKRRP